MIFLIEISVMYRLLKEIIARTCCYLKMKGCEKLYRTLQIYNRNKIKWFGQEYRIRETNLARIKQNIFIE